VSTSMARRTGSTSGGGLRAVLDAGPRPPRATAVTAVRTFAWRALLKIRHVPEQLSDVVGIPVIFTLLFTYMFGGALMDSTSEYLEFLLPGSLVMSVLLVTIYAGVTLHTDIASGVFDRFRTLPIWRPAPIVGALFGDAGRYLIASAFVIALGLLLGFRPAGGATGLLAAVGVTVAFAFGLSWVWTTVALLVRSEASLFNVGMLVLFPMTFASNTFVRPQTMPTWLETFVDLNPVSHLVTAARGLTAGTATLSQAAWPVLAAAAMTLVFAPLTMHLYRTRQ
jgi:ABC-2 type transport system permease protein